MMTRGLDLALSHRMNAPVLFVLTAVLLSGREQLPRKR
jgi:hypothetical protein